MKRKGARHRKTPNHLGLVWVPVLGLAVWTTTTFIWSQNALREGPRGVRFPSLFGEVAFFFFGFFGDPHFGGAQAHSPTSEHSTDPRLSKSRERKRAGVLSKVVSSQGTCESSVKEPRGAFLSEGGRRLDRGVYTSENVRTQPARRTPRERVSPPRVLPRERERERALATF